MSREYTRDEVQQKFLEQVRAEVRYWLNEDRAPTAKEKLEGLAFSIMCIMDGCTGMPGFILAPRPHESDREFHQEEGDNWYPENHEIEDQIKADIAGGLHELLWNVLNRCGGI